jgi:hypothetical protein
VAATIYAAEAVARDDPAEAGWAVSRLIDVVFGEVESDRQLGDADDFVADCAAPQVQSVLSQILSIIQLLERTGLSVDTLETVRRAYDTG